MQGQVQFNAKLIENSCSLPNQLVRMSTRDSFEIPHVSTTLSSFPGMGFKNDAAPTEFEKEEVG